jgi:putative ABC transport system ATP-binding protein
MDEPIIEVDKLKVIYNKGKPNEVRSLDDITVKIYPHEYVIIFGPSGCGKSTLLYAMSGLQAASEGNVMVNGKIISQMKKSEMVEMHQVGIGMIFQAFYLIPSLTVLENVCLPKVFRGESRSKRKEAGVKLLHRFSIVEQGDKFPSQLSGGQKQRVSIARSLVNNPEIIFADEPVGNLDSVSAENVMQILKELNEIDKKTVILVTHSAEHLHYADRIIYIKDGKLVKEEVNKEKRPPEALKKLPSVKYEDLTNELKLLMRTFKNLSLGQVGSLLVPFKANQLISHILSELSQEQIQTAGAYLKEFLFNNIELPMLKKNLDLDYEKGGAGWNKQRVKHFITRVEDITNIAKVIAEGKDDKSMKKMSEYLINFFHLKLEGESKDRFDSFLKLRIKNKIDRFELQKALDAPKILGGVGLYRGTAEKISREVEVIMLMKYSTY